MNRNIMQYNIKDFYSKLPHQQQYIYENKPKIIYLQDTLLKSDNKTHLKVYQ